MKKGTRWSNEELQLIKELYPKYGSRKTWEAFKAGGSDRSYDAIKAKGTVLGLKSPIAYRFAKGQTPANKGKKMSAELYEKAKPTMFKKGQVSHNLLPVGSIRDRGYSGTKKGKKPQLQKKRYKYIKVAEPNKWDLLHRYLWKQEHGAIPKGMLVVFKDGNQRNCVIGNLELITRAQNARRNYDPEKVKATVANPSDRYVIGRLAMKKPELREQLKDQPELIELARQRILLNRQIKKAKSS